MIYPVVEAPTHSTALTVCASASHARLGDGLLHVAMPWLGGPSGHVLLAGAVEEKEDGMTLVRGGEGALAGALTLEVGADLRRTVRVGYERILAEAGGLHLYRVWNALPEINASVAGLENYRAFNAGRFDAVTRHFGRDFAGRLPAASAVGCAGGRVSICFLAGTGVPRHIENPHQISSWDYPGEYGDPPPAFARGTVVTLGGQELWFLSGTAGIRGHATIGETLAAQFAVMAANIRYMLEGMQTPPTAVSSWRCFLRNVADLAEAQALFAEAFPDWMGPVQWLHADICRAELCVELEATFYHSPPPPISL